MIDKLARIVRGIFGQKKPPNSGVLGFLLIYLKKLTLGTIHAIIKQCVSCRDGLPPKTTNTHNN